MKPFWKTKNFQIRLKEPLGQPDKSGKIICPYAYRWVFIFFGFSIRIHQWFRSDDKRHYHDHPWWFTTIVLRGRYTDVSEQTIDGKPVIVRDQLKQWSIRHRKAYHRHYVEIPPEGCITLLMTGMPLRKWGFWVDGKMKRPLKYFYKFGHPPCEEQ